MKIKKTPTKQQPNPKEKKRKQISGKKKEKKEKGNKFFLFPNTLQLNVTLWQCHGHISSWGKKKKVNISYKIIPGIYF